MASKVAKAGATAAKGAAGKVLKEIKAKDPNKIVKPKEKSIFNIVNGLRYYGVGSKVTRTIYKFPDTYWILTKVVLSKDQMHGSIWGRMIWKGRAKPINERIGRAIKPDWKLLELPNYKHFKGSQNEVEEMIKKSAEPWIEDEEYNKMANKEIKNDLQQM